MELSPQDSTRRPAGLPAQVFGFIRQLRPLPHEMEIGASVGLRIAHLVQSATKPGCRGGDPHPTFATAVPEILAALLWPLRELIHPSLRSSPTLTKDALYPAEEILGVHGLLLSDNTSVLLQAVLLAPPLIGDHLSGLRARWRGQTTAWLEPLPDCSRTRSNNNSALAGIHAQLSFAEAERIFSLGKWAPYSPFP